MLRRLLRFESGCFNEVGQRGEDYLSIVYDSLLSKLGGSFVIEFIHFDQVEEVAEGFLDPILAKYRVVEAKCLGPGTPDISRTLLQLGRGLLFIPLLPVLWSTLYLQSRRMLQCGHWHEGWHQCGACGNGWS